MIRRLSILAAMGVCALAAPASAQMAPPPREMLFEHHMGPPSPEMEKAMAEHRAQMARDMHVILRLRPDQEGAWKAFEATMAPPPPEAPPGPSPATTPERLDVMGKHMARMEERRARADSALRAFYAALSPEQQQVFDAAERLRGPHGPGGPPMMFHREMAAPPH
jgi:protein CpxP